jgi:2-oxo-4-hydroxy-4-carboxy-5-ureidoimidazoline decarboxylase
LAPWRFRLNILPSEGNVTLDEINGMNEGQFVAAFGSLFEGSPWVAAGAWQHRPFRSVELLHNALCSVMYAAPKEQQLALIKAHPDLVGRAALAGTLSRQSAGEQAAAGLDHLSPEEVVRFTELNAAYFTRFGFPFVICARENKKDSILAGFATRLHNSRDQEIQTALGEIAKIAWLRLLDVMD